MHIFQVKEAELRLPAAGADTLTSLFSQAKFRFSAISDEDSERDGYLETPYAVLLPNVNFTVFDDYRARKLIDSGVQVKRTEIRRQVLGCRLADIDGHVVRTNLRLCCSKGQWTDDMELDVYFSDKIVQSLKRMFRGSQAPAKGFVSLNGLRRTNYSVQVRRSEIRMSLKE